MRGHERDNRHQKDRAEVHDDGTEKSAGCVGAAFAQESCAERHRDEQEGEQRCPGSSEQNEKVVPAFQRVHQLRPSRIGMRRG